MYKLRWSLKYTSFLDKIKLKIVKKGKLNYNKENFKLSIKEILYSFFDTIEDSFAVFFKAHPIYRQSFKSFEYFKQHDRQKFYEKIHYLKKMGYIKTSVSKKKKYLELTKKGVIKIKNLSLDDIKIKHSKKWDGKWRVIVFDIPEKLKKARDMLRCKLLHLGFVKIQESVYVYPFECAVEIKYISEVLNIQKYVLIMITDIIQGEEKIILNFINHKVLRKSQI